MTSSSQARANNIYVTVNVKRTKDEVSLAQTELERLHGYVQNDQSPNKDWAKAQIKEVTQMILLPNSDQIKKQIESKMDEPKDP